MAKNTESYYDGIAKGYDELHFEEQKEKFKLLKENMNIDEKQMALDIGCGTFFSFDYFGWNLYGIEPSSEMVNLFLEKHPEEKNRIRVGCAEALLEEYDENSFDAVICVSAVHHFKNPAKTFEDMKKICRKSAEVGITLLRNIGNFNQIEDEINSSFKVVKKIDSDSSKDVVFICRIK